MTSPVKAVRWGGLAAMIAAVGVLALRAPGSEVAAPWLFIPGLIGYVAASVLVGRRSLNQQRG